jgi:hypothetical protein
MNPWQRPLLWASTAVLTLTGLAYAGMRYLMSADDPFSAYNHPLQPWALDLHVLAAPALVLAIGWFWGSHILPMLRKKAGSRPSGLALIGIALVMTVSGYLLQVSTAAALRTFAAWLHGISGVAFFLLLAGHSLFSRQVGPRAIESRFAEDTLEPRSRPDPAALPHRREARRGGDGTGLASGRHDARPARRDQGPS